MSKELVEVIAKAVERSAHVVIDYGNPLLDNPGDVARAALSAIEREGFKVVPVEEFDRLEEIAMEHAHCTPESGNVD
jgi:hypothetical protein